MAGVDLLFGPMLLGVLLNTLLYGVMATQMLTYYIRFPNDFRWIRYFVLYLLLAETAVVVVEVGIIYQPLVLEYGTHAAVTFFPKLLPGDSFLIVFVATPIQLFTAWRIKVITQSYIAPVLIALLSIASFGGGLLLSFSVLRSSQFIDFGVFATEAAVWLISSAVCDIVLAVAMAYALLTRKTGIDKAVDGYINRIVRLTIESGSLTATAALIDVILSISFPRSAMNFVVDFPLSTLYTCSLLAMLNARERKNAGDTEKLQGSTMGMGGKGMGSKPISVSVQLSKSSSEGTTEKDSEYSLSYYTYESEPKRSIDDTATTTTTTTTSDVTLAPPPPPKRRSQMPTSYRNDVPLRAHSRFRPRSRSTLSRRSHKAPTEVAYSDKSEVLGGVVSQSFDSATTFDTLAMMPAQFPPVPPPPPVLQSPVRAKLLAPSATITKAQWAKTSTRWASEDDDETDDVRAQRPTRTGSNRHRGGAQSHDLRLNIPPSSQPEVASSRIHVRAASHLDLVSPIDPAPSPAPSFGFAAAMFSPSPSPMSATGSRRPLPQHVPQASTSRAAPMSTPAHLDPRVRELITSRQNL